MAIRTDEAFVLKRVPLRETSILATLFTKKAGKIKVLAKGVRQEKNSRAALLEPFTYLSIVYYEKLRSDTHLLSSADILDSHLKVRNHLDRFAYASYVTELADTLFGAHDPFPDVFNLLKDAFHLFEEAPPVSVTRAFEIKALERMGWLPVLDQCAACGKKDLKEAFFHSSQGGVICPECDRREAGTIPISQGTIQSLRFFLKSSFTEAVRLKLSRETLYELERMSRRFLQFHLDYPLKTPRFLSEIRPLLKITK